MTTTLTQPAPPTANRTPTGGRLASIVTGSLLAVGALTLLAIGAVMLWGDSKKDADGFISTDSHRYATSTNALNTEDLDVDADGLGWFADGDHYGKIRLEARSHEGQPVFVGIARSNDVDAYLAGTAHATVTDVDYSPFSADYRTHAGERKPAAPASQPIWAASAHGAGEQTLDWDVEDGSWSVVVMNEDGSAGVEAGVRAGAKISWLGPAGWATAGAGVLLLFVAGGLVYLGARRPRDRTPIPYAA